MNYWQSAQKKRPEKKGVEKKLAHNKDSNSNIFTIFEANW